MLHQSQAKRAVQIPKWTTPVATTIPVMYVGAPCETVLKFLIFEAIALQLPSRMSEMIMGDSGKIHEMATGHQLERIRCALGLFSQRSFQILTPQRDQRKPKPDDGWNEEAMEVPPGKRRNLHLISEYEVRPTPSLAHYYFCYCYIHQPFSSKRSLKTPHFLPRANRYDS